MNEFLSVAELESTLTVPYNDEYDDFVFGRWKNAVLVNGTGSHLDSALREYSGPALPTSLLAGLPGVARLISTGFNESRLKWARLFLQEKGVLLPHVDFVRMANGFTRLHVVLRTNAECLHSEGTDVYHMRLGELWALRVDEIHSACNRSDSARVTLCLDFEPGVPISSLVRAPYHQSDLSPMMIARPLVTAEEVAGYRQMAAGLTEENVNDVVAALARVHFSKSIHAGAMYDWLLEGAEAALGDWALAKVRALRVQGLGE